MYSRLSIAYLYIMELLDEDRWKPVATIIMCINNSLSCLMASYLLLGGRDAKFFILMSIIILLYALLFTPLIPESPKLLYSLKRYDDARDSLERIARINGITYQRIAFEVEVKRHTEIVDNPEKVEEQPANWFSIFKYRQFLINVVVLIFAFVFNEFSMYMLSFMLKYNTISFFYSININLYLPGDKYVNMFLLGWADFWASITSGIVLTYFSTKSAMIISFSSIFIWVFVHMTFGHYDFIGIPMIFIIRYGITIEWWLNYYVIYDLFPANLASIVYGLCNITAGLATILSPVAVELLRNSLIIVLILGGICEIKFINWIINQGLISIREIIYFYVNICVFDIK